MIERLLPDASCSEMFSDAPESTMFPSEAALVAKAVPERRREFATVRHCARQAMLGLGVSEAALLPDADGAPRWPVGIVGSMTHCRGYRAAVVAHSETVPGIGIDAEPDVPLPAGVVDLVLRHEERGRHSALSNAFPGRNWDTILFCAKEAIFKAWFPANRSWLEFTDVSVTLHPDGRFTAFVHAPPAGGIEHDYCGRWIVGRGVVVVAVWDNREAAGETEELPRGMKHASLPHVMESRIPGMAVPQ